MMRYAAAVLTFAIAAAAVYAADAPAAGPAAGGDKELRGEPLIAMTPYQVFEQCSKATVRVVVQDERGANVIASAMGFFVKADGTLVTAAHVVKGAKFIRLQLEDKSVAFVDRVLAIDEANDLALLKANLADVPVLAISDLKPQKRDTVYAIGGSATVPLTLSEGVIEAPANDDDARPLLRTSATVAATNAGAPYLDYTGRLIGVALGSADAKDPLSAAIPASHAAALLNGEHKPGEPLASAGRDRIAPAKRDRTTDQPDPAVAGAPAVPGVPGVPGAPQHQGVLAPKAPPIEGYDSVGFDTLKAYRFDPDLPAEQKQPVPDAVAALKGKKIALQGYMIPIDFQDGGTNEFILVSVVPGCFFCQKPMPNDWIEVATVDGKRFPYPGDDMIIVTGSFDVGPVYDGVFLRSIYRLKAEGVKPAKAN